MGPLPVLEATLGASRQDVAEEVTRQRDQHDDPQRHEHVVEPHIQLQDVYRRHPLLPGRTASDDIR